MSDERVLPALLGRESVGLLQYVREAFPWAKGADVATAEEVVRLGEAENEALTQLGRLIVHHHIPLKTTRAFPSSFLNLNYMSVSFLVPRLLDAHRQAVVDLERDCNLIANPVIREAVDEFLGLKRTTVAALERLLQPKPQLAA